MVKLKDQKWLFPLVCDMVYDVGLLTREGWRWHEERIVAVDLEALV